MFNEINKFQLSTVKAELTRKEPNSRLLPIFFRMVPI